MTKVRKGAMRMDVGKVPVSLRLESTLSRKTFVVGIWRPRGSFSEVVRELVGGWAVEGR